VGSAALAISRRAGLRRRRLIQSATARSRKVASSQHREARAEKSAAGQIGLAAFYWVALAAVPAAGEPLLERGEFG
jgi:hypothetical protein